MNLKTLEFAMEAINNSYDLTLNTDNSFESVRDKEKILRNRVDMRREFFEAVDHYLSLRKFIDESLDSPRQVVHMMVKKPLPSNFSEELK